MIKKEKEIILARYELILDTEKLGYDKSDSKKELISLMDMLGMQKDRYVRENEVLSKHNNYSPIVVDMFDMLFDSFSKYDCLIRYDLDDVEEAFEHLRWKMPEEELSYNLKRISIIKDYF